MDLDDGAAGLELDRHHVEATGTIRQSMAHQVLERQLHDPPALQARDRLGRAAEPAAVARLDFDEDEGGAVTRNDVQFATTAAVAPLNDCVPAAFQLATGQIFADFPERDSCVTHEPSRAAKALPPRRSAKSGQRRTRRTTTSETETAEHAENTWILRARCTLRSMSCLLHLTQRFVEDPDGRVRLLPREHERGRE